MLCVCFQDYFNTSTFIEGLYLPGPLWERHGVLGVQRLRRRPLRHAAIDFLPKVWDFLTFSVILRAFWVILRRISEDFWERFTCQGDETLRIASGAGLPGARRHRSEVLERWDCGLDPALGAALLSQSYCKGEMLPKGPQRAWKGSLHSIFIAYDGSWIEF